MFSEINYQVLRASWTGFLPLPSWVCGFLLVIFRGGAQKRRLSKLLLWILPVFLVQTGRTRTVWLPNYSSNHD